MHCLTSLEHIAMLDKETAAGLCLGPFKLPGRLLAFVQAPVDDCVTHVSRKLREVEDLHSMELWRTAEVNKPINSEVLLRAMVKFAHFVVRDIAPANAPEHRLSLLKLANKWVRTCELIRQFNAAVAACPSPTLRTIYFPQYESRILPLPKESLADLLLQLQKILNVDIPPIHR